MDSYWHCSYRLYWNLPFVMHWNTQLNHIDAEKIVEVGSGVVESGSVSSIQPHQCLSNVESKQPTVLYIQWPAVT